MSRKRKGCELSESEDSRKGDFSPDDDDYDYHPTAEEGSIEESSSEIEEEDSHHQRRRSSQLFTAPLESTQPDTDSYILYEENGETNTHHQSDECGDSESSEEIFSVRRPLMLPNCRPNRHILEDSSSSEEEEEPVKPGPSSKRDESESESCEPLIELTFRRRPSMQPAHNERRVSVNSVLPREGPDSLSAADDAEEPDVAVSQHASLSQEVSQQASPGHCPVHCSRTVYMSGVFLIRK